MKFFKKWLIISFSCIAIATIISYFLGTFDKKDWEKALDVKHCVNNKIVMLNKSGVKHYRLFEIVIQEPITTTVIVNKLRSGCFEIKTFEWYFVYNSATDKCAMKLINTSSNKSNLCLQIL